MSTAVQTEEKMIVIKLLGKEYVVPVLEVKSIERWQQPTRVPGVEAYIKGVINLRGVVTPIIDLQSRLELPSSEVSESTRIIIVAIGELEAGFIVDEANDVISACQHEIEQPTETAEKAADEWVTGIIKRGNRILNLLDSKAVLDRSIHSEPAQSLV
ncbi:MULTISPECIES: chemotaxis protein CheW [Bacillus]|uniref:Chemotaxis protein CheW n=2 Tax=Bacillus TaxID=1386 RepID=A0A0M4FW57_9BACI|nr:MULTISPECIES: chemotaxis protein CheW [Bacillus]ALC81075.1 chemotaxis protein CheW [Bacillus gobiensis]MBP1080036.1 purine-binding chemotaxis protein CheW [Bacillus capparidis]MED1095425.1 chemotaxis protein CheW [Bacillus capparidis]